ncbi:roadblock/LC7 domain-containing protein [Streptomyces sp. MJP52]|uniref:roadblock/LC7 domain-containing protein n=1 Tax=Streptomyces sp. MJP52 TaxID=2940555 RepID=UPI002473F2ED|nr:roadblock/LC7 domain-containing protein [Streptomyces sp. MJP52]
MAPSQNTASSPNAAPTQQDSQTFNWLLAAFVRNTDGVRDAVAVSSDGLLIAVSEGLGRTEADHLAAIVSGLSSLARSASRRYGFDGVKLIMIEMGRGFLLVSAIRDGSCLGVLADSSGELGLVGYEMAVLAERAGDLLTPALIADLRQSLPR